MVKSYAEILALQSRMEALSRLVMLMLTMAFLLAAMLLFVSCEHKELVYGGAADTTARFDWSAADSVYPASMRVVAFTPTTHPVLFPVAGYEEGHFYLPTGEYHFISYNSDNESLYAEGDYFDSYELYSKSTELSRVSPMFAGRRAIPRAPGTDDQHIVMEPGDLWVSTLTGKLLVSIEPNYITFPMQPATHEYVFTIRNVDNVRYLEGVSMTVSGVSSGILPASMTITDTHCIVPFEGTVNKENASITGRVMLFGHCPSGEAGEHKLVVYAQMRDGTKWYYTFDVTNALHDPDHVSIGGSGQTEIPINIDELPLPKPIMNGSGLHPEVDTWQEVEVPINL